MEKLYKMTPQEFKLHLDDIEKRKAISKEQQPLKYVPNMRW
jgi:hypothetical protein